MNLLTTLSNSLMQGFFPKGWDLAKIDGLAEVSGSDLLSKKSWWNPEFKPIPCQSLGDFDVYMGHEIALEISNSRKNGHELAMILPVGPMGMYRWAVYFLNQWNVNCSHVHGFNMDEWSDADGNTLPPDNSGAFQFAMEKAFYGPLGQLTVPKNQRNFALKIISRPMPRKLKLLKPKVPNLLQSLVLAVFVILRFGNHISLLNLIPLNSGNCKPTV